MKFTLEDNILTSILRRGEVSTETLERIYESYSESEIRGALSNLEKDGLIRKSNNEWSCF